MAFAVLAPQVSHAQLRGLKDRLQKRAEAKVKRTIEEKTTRRLENELNKVIDNTVDDLANGLESSIEGMVFSSEPPPPIELEDNATGNPDASYVTYTIATRVQVGGNDMASRILQRYGALEEVVYTYGNKQRTDEGKESSQIMDADTGQNINLDHEKKEWWSMSFDEMFESLDQMRDEAIASANEEGEITTNVEDVQFSIDRTGKVETINGVSAEQVIMTIGGSYQTNIKDNESGDETTMQGNTYMVVESWQSKEVAGYNTLASYQQAMAEVVGEALSGSGFQSMFSALQSSPELQEAAEKASKELDQEEGLPVRTKTYYVQVPEGATFDKDAVFAESTSEEFDPNVQRVLMTTISEIGNLTIEPFDESLLAPTAGYTEVESPLKAYMNK